MSRVADSTIQGFLYQFNITLQEILKASEDDEITVEGIIEDIDIGRENNTVAIQCKYHEGQEKFSLSKIYKPILQMMKTFAENPNANIEYILYMYFPNLVDSEMKITLDDLTEIIETKNKEYLIDYIAYLKKCNSKEILDIISKKRKSDNDKQKIKKYFYENDMDLKFDLQQFLTRFKIVVGEKYEKIKEINKKLLQEQGFSKEDVDDLFFPNAIQIIADLSINKIVDKRKTNKRNIIKLLKEHKDTAFSRWTKEIISRKKILQIKRKQLSQNLNKNYRERCFILNPKWIENFDKEISNFIRNYKEKYCWKVKLHKPTTFCIMNVDKNYITQLISELYEMNVKVETGYVGEKFYKEKFMANPQKKIKDNWIEFNIRLIDYSDNFIYVIKNMQIDDLFIIGKEETENIGKLGKNIEKIEIENLKELEFLLNLRKEV